MDARVLFWILVAREMIRFGSPSNIKGNIFYHLEIYILAIRAINSYVFFLLIPIDNKIFSSFEPSNLRKLDQAQPD